MRATLLDAKGKPIRWLGGVAMINVEVRFAGNSVLCRPRGTTLTVDRTSFRATAQGNKAGIQSFVIPLATVAVIDWLDDDGHPLTDEGAWRAAFDSAQD